MAANIQCPKCRETIRITRSFKGKLVGASVGSAVGSLSLTFGGLLALTPVTGVILLGLIGLGKGIREDSTVICLHCDEKINVMELK